MKAYFAGAEETKHQDPIEYWSITMQGTSEKKKIGELPIFDDTEENSIEFTYKGRNYKIQKPLNMEKGDTLIFRAPGNILVREIPRNHIKELITDDDLGNS